MHDWSVKPIDKYNSLYRKDRQERKTVKKKNSFVRLGRTNVLYDEGIDGYILSYPILITTSLIENLLRFNRIRISIFQIIIKYFHFYRHRHFAFFLCRYHSSISRDVASSHAEEPYETMCEF